MRRPAPAPATAPPSPAAQEADRLRQLLHELRTPVTAIQGFAEVIQQQLFGPTPHEYRGMAANIAGDAARMLAGFDELERLAKLETGVLTLESGSSDLAQVVTACIQRMAPHCERRGVGFQIASAEAELAVALAFAEAERMVWRLLATLAGRSEAGETLLLTLEANDSIASLTVQLPASLASLDDEGLFAATAPAADALTAGMFGTGFSLRLAASEARAAGGSLVRAGDRIILAMPLARSAQQGSYEADNEFGL